MQVDQSWSDKWAKLESIQSLKILENHMQKLSTAIRNLETNELQKIQVSLKDYDTKVATIQVQMNQTMSDLQEKTKAMESIMQRQYSDFSQKQSQLEKDFTANFI